MQDRLLHKSNRLADCTAVLPLGHHISNRMHFLPFSPVDLAMKVMFSRLAVPSAALLHHHRQEVAPRSASWGSSTAGSNNFARRRSWSRPSAPVVTHAMQPEDPKTERQQRQEDRRVILGAGLLLTAATGMAVQYGGDLLAIANWDGLSLGEDASFGAGDLLGAALWGISLYYASPWQLLLLFLGKIETERPSDAVLRQFGLLAGLPVDAVDYQAPAWVHAAAAAVFAGSGCAMALALGSWLGDASWSVSTGLGSCMAAGMYEVGRPQRLTVEESKKLEAQWKDFEVFANERLQKSGRCHESEVIRSFRRQYGRYRQPSAISDAVIRDMIRNWHSMAERSGQGYYKNLSLREVPLSEGPLSESGAAAGAGGSTEEEGRLPQLGGFGRGAVVEKDA